MNGTVAAMALYAGQGVGQVSDVSPAAQVVSELTDQAAVLPRRKPERERTPRAKLRRTSRPAGRDQRDARSGWSRCAERKRIRMDSRALGRSRQPGTRAARGPSPRPGRPTASRASSRVRNASMRMIRPFLNVHTCAQLRSSPTPLPRPRACSWRTTITLSPASIPPMRQASSPRTSPSNEARRNGDLGIDAVQGVIDGGGNRASGNGDPRPVRERDLPPDRRFPTRPKPSTPPGCGVAQKYRFGREATSRFAWRAQ